MELTGTLYILNLELEINFHEATHSKERVRSSSLKHIAMSAILFTTVCEHEHS